MIRSMSHFRTSGVSSPSRLPAVMQRKLLRCKCRSGRIRRESQRSSIGTQDELRVSLTGEGKLHVENERRQEQLRPSRECANCSPFDQFTEFPVVTCDVRQRVCPLELFGKTTM